MLSLIMQIVIWCILFANDLGSRCVLKQKPNSHNVTTIKLSLYSSYKKGLNYIIIKLIVYEHTDCELK